MRWSWRSTRSVLWLVALMFVAGVLNIVGAYVLAVIDGRPPPPLLIHAAGPDNPNIDWPAPPPPGVEWPEVTSLTESRQFGHWHLEARAVGADRRMTHSMGADFFGWPVASMKRVKYRWPGQTFTRGARTDDLLTPHWPGLIVNPILGGVGLWVVIFLPINFVSAARERRRRASGHCPECGYNLDGTGGTAAGCPECGWGR